MKRESIVSDSIDKVRKGKNQGIQGIRGIGKTFVLKEVEKKLSMSGKYLPIYIPFAPFLDNKKEIFWSIISKIRVVTDSQAETRLKLAKKLEEKGYIALPDVLKLQRQSEYYESIPRLLSSTQMDLDLKPVLILDDIHLGPSSFLTEFSPIVCSSLLPLNETNIETVSMEGLSISEIRKAFEEHTGAADQVGAKKLKDLTGGIPSYVQAILPRLSDWVKRKGLSLDSVIVRKVWEDEMNGGILSLMAKSYFRSYVSLFGKETAQILTKIANGKKVRKSEHVNKLQQIGLLEAKDLIDKVLEAWLRNIQSKKEEV